MAEMEIDGSRLNWHHFAWTMLASIILGCLAIKVENICGEKLSD